MYRDGQQHAYSTNQVMVFLFSFYLTFFYLFIISFCFTDIEKGFWGIVKRKVFGRKPHTVDELKEFILLVFMYIDANQNLCVTVCQIVGYKFHKCCNIHEGHFEHLSG